MHLNNNLIKVFCFDTIIFIFNFKTLLFIIIFQIYEYIFQLFIINYTFRKNETNIWIQEFPVYINLFYIQSFINYYVSLEVLLQIILTIGGNVKVKLLRYACPRNKYFLIFLKLNFWYQSYDIQVLSAIVLQ